MLKKRPVVGAVVIVWDAAATRTKPVAAFTELATTNGFWRTVPVKLSLMGCRMVGFVETWISKPLRAAELWTLTATTSVPPTVPWNITGVGGHEVDEASAMQTIPGVAGTVTTANTATECVREPLLPITVTL